jgi:hypothetical protein
LSLLTGRTVVSLCGLAMLNGSLFIAPCRDGLSGLSMCGSRAAVGLRALPVLVDGMSQ